MEMQRTNITLPGELLAEIDRTMGPMDLTAFIIEMTRAELGRRKQHLSPARSVGKIAEPLPGTSAWMKSIREAGEARLTLRHF